MKSRKPLTDEELEAGENSRDMEAELLKSVKQMVAKKGHVAMSPVISARKKSGLSQTEFAKLLGVSVRTLQEWEQAAVNPAAQLKP